MKNPLTSKERRGLLAVAAAALLCIGTGFVARSCGSFSPKGAAVAVEEAGDSVSDSPGHSDKFESPNGKRARREKRRKEGKEKASKKKAQKRYPVRDPLSEPCD